MTCPEYRRRPLPQYARTPLGWVALCMMGLVFSPFVGFAIHGKVSTAGLVIGLWFALVPLAGLAAIAVLRWQGWRRLPADLAEEWASGKVVPAEVAPHVVPPVRFTSGKHWLEMRGEGLAFSRSCLLSMQGVSLAGLRVADFAGEVFIPWDDIVDWGVDTDSDGPDFYRLSLRAGGLLRVRRLAPEDADECRLLDAVRSVGRVPLRLRCDVDCR